MNDKHAGGGETELFVAIVNARQMLNARRRMAAEHRKRQAEQERCFRILIQLLAAVLLLEVGGVIALTLLTAFCT